MTNNRDTNSNNHEHEVSAGGDRPRRTTFDARRYKPTQFSELVERLKLRTQRPVEDDEGALRDEF